MLPISVAMAVVRATTAHPHKAHLGAKLGQALMPAGFSWLVIKAAVLTWLCRFFLHTRCCKSGGMKHDSSFIRDSLDFALTKLLTSSANGIDTWPRP